MPLLSAAIVAAAAPAALAFTPGFSSGDTRAALIAAGVAALAALSIVPLANRVGGVLVRSGAGELLLFTAALASAGAAAIHFSVAKMHFEEYALFGVFFVGSGIAQLVWSVWLLLRRWPPLLALGAIGNAAIVALWAVDRVWGLPLGPDPWKPDPWGLGDGISSGFEVLVVIACVAALARRERRPLHRTAKVTLTLGAGAATTLALLSVLGVGSSVLPPAQ